MRKLLAGAVVAAAMAATTTFGTASASTASTEAQVGIAGVGNQVCDYGEACLFAWPGFDGPTWDANGCGPHMLDGWMQNQTSSVRTHGNPITLWNWNDWDSQPDHWVILAEIGAGLNVVLGPWEDKADAITVWC
ncbi:hypothetical protein [Saccharothrix xinjiangensis]|uniref:Peptidase inhibitor family I36 n=1 Tax=Saccharothrix xinjiangensis TaxID=204798 RepID=A0ABV9Y452_9PSEU